MTFKALAPYSMDFNLAVKYAYLLNIPSMPENKDPPSMDTVRNRIPIYYRCKQCMAI